MSSQLSDGRGDSDDSKKFEGMFTFRPLANSLNAAGEKA
jgi:hypothetical protein